MPSIEELEAQIEAIKRKEKAEQILVAKKEKPLPQIIKGFGVPQKSSGRPEGGRITGSGGRRLLESMEPGDAFYDKKEHVAAWLSLGKRLGIKLVSRRQDADGTTALIRM